MHQQPAAKRRHRLPVPPPQGALETTEQKPLTVGKAELGSASHGRSGACGDTHARPAPPVTPLEAGALCCHRPVRFYSLPLAGVGSFSSQVPGSVPAHKDASKLLVSKEFLFHSSLPTLLLASSVGRSLPQTQGQSRKTKKRSICMVLCH